MITSRSGTGLALAGIYALLCVFLVATQGLFGESFIVILLGLPWTLALAAVEFGNASGSVLMAAVIAPMVLNAVILYGIGYWLGRYGPKKAIVALAAVLAVLVAGFYAFNAYIYAEKQEGAAVERYRGTLTGVQVCLPHKNTDGPHTMECAIGMKTDAGDHYALDFAAMSQIPPTIQDGDRFEATGMITPIEMLSTDQWQKYDIEGIFSVTDSVKKL